MSVGHGQRRCIRATEVHGGRLRSPRGSSYRERVGTTHPNLREGALRQSQGFKAGEEVVIAVWRETQHQQSGNCHEPSIARPSRIKR